MATLDLSPQIQQKKAGDETAEQNSLFWRSDLVTLLTPELILSAYHQGCFPMAQGKHGEVGFYYFEPRGIVPLDERFNVRRSLRQAMKRFEITIDTSFENVIRHCSRHDTDSDSEVWLSEEMIPAYIELHKRGIAHSVESWNAGKLVGGLYGIAIGKAFCGESMFSIEPYASQAALVALVEYLRKNDFTLLDAQMASEHLEQFGLYEVTQEEYMKMFNEAQTA